MPTAPASVPTNLPLYLSAPDRLLYESTARLRGLTLSGWIKLVIREAARRELEELERLRPDGWRGCELKERKQR
jgi:hypothetical protein